MKEQCNSGIENVLAVLAFNIQSPIYTPSVPRQINTHAIYIGIMAEAKLSYCTLRTKAIYWTIFFS